MDLAIHHGAEAAAFLGVGTYVFSNFWVAAASYGTAKITYLVGKEVLELFAPELSKGTKRTISYCASLLVGGATLNVATQKIVGSTMTVWQTVQDTATVTISSMALRTLAKKVLKYAGGDAD